MGKASRRKRDRAAAVAAAEPSAPRNNPNQRRGLAITAVLVAAFALGFGAWLHYSGSTTPVGLGAVLPDPNLSHMTAPVARVIREARQAALEQPGSATAAGQLGQVLHAHWRYDAAAQSYQIAHRLAPENFRWVYLLAGVVEIRGVSGERVDQLFRQAIRLSPRFPPVYVRYADALMRLGRWSEAHDAYATAIELDPTLVLAHRGMGQAASLLGDGPAAVEQLEQAAALSPKDRITQVALARAYSLAGRDDLAAEAARKAQALTFEASLPDPIFFEVQNLAVDPESLWGRFTRSVKEGDYATAIEVATLLEESGVRSARQQLTVASKQRAMQLAMAGEFDGALAEFERAARLAPNDPEIEHNWGTVLLRRGDLDEARRHFEHAIELNSQSADSLYNLGVVLEGLGRIDDAIARFTEAVAIDPQHFLAVERLTELSAGSEN